MDIRTELIQNLVSKMAIDRMYLNQDTTQSKFYEDFQRIIPLPTNVILGHFRRSKNISP